MTGGDVSRDMADGGFESMPGAGVLDLAARWRTAEAQLYSLIVSDPDLYEMVVTLVVEARDVLRTTCTTTAQLVAVDAKPVLDRCPTTEAVRTAGFDAGVAFNAARAQRLREMS